MVTGIALWLVFGVLAGTVVAAGAPVLFGMRSFTVLSGSMEPVLDVGDVVVAKPVVATDLRVGDVITFPDEERRELVTHRVRSIHLAGSRAAIETRGDANSASEHWSVAADGRVGRVAYHVPLVGYALVWTHGRLARLLLIVIPALALGALELGRIWRPRAELSDAAA
ncbi:MAG: signal peptidase [Thermoleophilaceae bacterium]|nr:signal peptidase [Thermoleophilaceae bacterium]